MGEPQQLVLFIDGESESLRALEVIRDVGIVPWEWIVDETRILSTWRYAANVGDYVADTVGQARIDLWAVGAPPVIIAESRSLAGVLNNPAFQYLVPLTEVVDHVVDLLAGVL